MLFAAGSCWRALWRMGCWGSCRGDVGVLGAVGFLDCFLGGFAWEAGDTVAVVDNSISERAHVNRSIDLEIFFIHRGRNGAPCVGYGIGLIGGTLSWCFPIQ